MSDNINNVEMRVGDKNTNVYYLKLSLLIFSLITTIYLFYFDSFIITNIDLNNFHYSMMQDNLIDIVELQYFYFVMERFAVNYNGYVIGSLLFLIGILGIAILAVDTNREPRFALISAIIQLPNGILFFILESRAQNGLNMLDIMPSSLEIEYTMGVFRSVYWMEFICHTIFFISVILLIISTHRNALNHVRSALIPLAIGFLIMIIAIIFSISTVNKFIEDEILDLEVYYSTEEVAGGLISAIVLNSTAKIMMIISILFVLINYQRHKNNKFVIIFSVLIGIYLILILIHKILLITYSFSLYVNPEIFTIYSIISKRYNNLQSLKIISKGFYWFIFFGGCLSILKSFVLDKSSAIQIKKPNFQDSQAQPQKIVSNKKQSPLPENEIVDETEKRFCTVCGTIAEDDSIVCASCGAFVPK